ncbi:molybdopterin-binding protein [Marininema halotolerans]|uniref:Molybdopterin molybdenumtransferase n=1 Tax=Marininema halotolerans TaxID=1155944 RepID=A0A1I6TN65_9BACL|nr:molybdopterin-binding protein [Marininema halotolerans]SFS90568.1 molybdenum cofactor synthesis domain-containing protein [Marininema halotolerans]
MKSSLKEVPLSQAIGLVLAHDLTQVIPGKVKGPLFRKGHIVREEDMEALLSIGKEHIYVIEWVEGELHEDIAAMRIATAVQGSFLSLSEPKEGKVSLLAEQDGLLLVDAPRVHAINQIEQVVLSTLKTKVPVQRGEVIAASRVIPLIYPESGIEKVEQIAKQGDPVLQILPYRSAKVGIVTTGNEIAKGRITDRFGPILHEKVHRYGADILGQTFAGDDRGQIQQQIESFIEQGADMVLVTGGMSVDPDDRTPGAIMEMGAEVVSYGTPMLPGSMLMIAYMGHIPILGLPGCVIHDKKTSFDVFLPRLLAGERISREEVTILGYGGLHSC